MSSSLRSVSDGELLSLLRELVRRGHALEADLIAHLGEIDRRQLHVREGYPSLFRYCVDALHFSESVAYQRIGVARCARQVPELLAALRRGDLHLSGARLLVPHLDAENATQLIAAARHKTKAQIEQLLADRSPRPDRGALVRRLPPPATPRPAGQGAAAGQVQLGPAPAVPGNADSATPRAPEPPPASARARCEPLGRARFRVSFTLDGDSHAKLEELRAWLRHAIPDGDLGAILARAIALLHAAEHKRKSAQTLTPRPRKPAPASALPSRHVPAELRRAVWKRDGGTCTYRSAEGRRCGAREFLQLDHIEPWQRVRAHSVANLRLRCRAHNQYAARQLFGEAHMARFRTKRDSTGPGASSPPRTHPTP